MTYKFVAVLGAAVLAVGCKPEPKPPAAAPPVITEAVAPLQLTIHAKDFAFTAPDTVPSGVTTITLINDGPGIHHAQLMKLDSGHTAAELGVALKKKGPPPAWAHFASGPNVPMAGAQATATLDLAPGSYAIVCLVDYPDHVPHFAKGMMHGLVVTPSTAPGAVLGHASYTITATEYAFAVSDTIKAGIRTFDVKMGGTQPHEVSLFMLLPGMTMKDVMKWGTTYKGAPPVQPLGGVSVAEPGMTVRFTADLMPGNYVMLCFVPDAKDGKPHMVHGMVKEFTVN